MDPLAAAVVRRTAMPSRHAAKAKTFGVLIEPTS